MGVQMVEPVTGKVLDDCIAQTAKAAGYEHGFGVEGCDLSERKWWASYQRQSQEEQAHNNRLPEYLRTCALETKRLNVTVPREYIFYDLVTGEHLERPGMIRLRKLMAERRISGVIFPALDRLSREPLHQQIFELEAAHYGVALHYADAPSGNDPGSQFARTILAHAAKLVKIANRKNNAAGNIGRVLSGNVPAGKTPYGYRYQAEYEDLGHGRRKLVSARWIVDALDQDGEPVEGSEAWTVMQIFRWIGNEGRTLYWVAKRLNALSIKPRYAKQWSPSLVRFIVANHCYTGHHVYNRATYVPNPERPLGDITAAVKRTIRQLKPESQWVHFEVPALVSEELWQLANQNLKERGRGRGKQGKRIDALLRGRVFCPSCDRLLSLYRDNNHRHLTYYLCATRSQGWKDRRCHVRSFRVAWLDEIVWDCVYALLKQPGFIEEQLSEQNSSKHRNELQKRIQAQQQIMERAQAKIRRIQDGYEADPPLYTAEEAEERIRMHRNTIARAQAEMERLQQFAQQQAVGQTSKEEVRRVLETLRDANLENATFAEKQDLIAKLGIKVYPSEDGKVVCITSTLQCPFPGSRFSPQKMSMASPKL